MIARLAHSSLNPFVTPRWAASAAAVCVVVAMGLLAPAAHASVTIKSFNAIPSTTQAGAHPDFSFEFGLTTRQGEPTPCSCDDAKDVTAHLPAGESTVEVQSLPAAGGLWLGAAGVVLLGLFCTLRWVRRRTAVGADGPLPTLPAMRKAG